MDSLEQDLLQFPPEHREEMREALQEEPMRGIIWAGLWCLVFWAALIDFILWLTN